VDAPDASSAAHEPAIAATALLRVSVAGKVLTQPMAASGDQTE